MADAMIKTFSESRKRQPTTSPTQRSRICFGALRVIPKDEYEKWLGTLKGAFNKPLDSLFLKWLADSKNKLKSTLKSAIVDHPE
ncbi:MAG: hypothetical protein JO122_16345 [Acetobacteraceae bacterium]|nr:hypothetical protein [Acetobacteraceae bacterium]